VIVIGGGPAGSTAATMLARQGHHVALLERERFPREHIGESLLPASIPILEVLGVREAMEQAGFLKKWGATMVWGSGPDPWSWYFRETNRSYPHSYQVWRPAFDQLLLDNSRRHGVEVREGHRAVEVLFESGRAAAVRHTSDDGADRVEPADFVIDASGQTALLGRALDLRRWDPFFRNMAVYGYFTGAGRLPEPDTTNILVEAYEDGWFWTIPLHNGLTSVGAVVDRQTADARVRGGGLEGFLRAEIGKTTRTAELVGGATLARGPHSIKDWSYVSDTVAGNGFVLVGDAACFVDPLFSSGVHLALSAGILGAAYGTTALKDPDLAAAAAPVYQRLYYTQYDRFHEMAKLFYSSNRSVESYFWEARRLLGEEASPYSPRQDFIRAVAGQPPQGYERAVLARGALPASFVDGLARAQDNLAARRAALARMGGRLPEAVPRLAADAAIGTQPVLGDGEFVWGSVLSSARRPEGVACSTLVADLLRRIDGRRSVGALIAAVSKRYPVEAADRVRDSLLFATETLFVDGAIEELRWGP
jgi:halogenation protein CepH